MKNKSILDISMRACFALLIFFLVTIMARFLTRQILIEKLGWNNVFTKIVFWGDENMGETPKLPDETEEIMVEVDWEKLYPFNNDDSASVVASFEFPIVDKYVSLVNAVETKITTYTEKLLFGHMEITRAGKSYNNLIGCAAMPMNNNSDEVIILNNGYMTYPEPAVGKEDIEVLANNVADFSKYLEDNGITFIYANAGSKVCKNNKQLPAGADENTNENADALIELLEEQNVNVLDYRPLQEERYPDWYSSYYITDHHWKNTTGLWAAGELAAVLNEKAGFDFDLSLFDKDNYSIETTEDYFLGGQGRILTTAVADLEPFSEVIPKFDTDLSIQIPTREVDARGKYEETLFRKKFYETIANYNLEDFEIKEDTYNSVMWRNDALGTVQNHITEDNEGKRILMIQDSFGWYLSTYLALDVPAIDFLNLNSFTGSLKAYIEETKPDAVVLLLCEKKIKAIGTEEYNGHSHFFDFR